MTKLVDVSPVDVQAQSVQRSWDSQQVQHNAPPGARKEQWSDADFTLVDASVPAQRNEAQLWGEAYGRDFGQLEENDQYWWQQDWVERTPLHERVVLIQAHVRGLLARHKVMGLLRQRLHEDAQMAGLLLEHDKDERVAGFLWDDDKNHHTQKEDAAVAGFLWDDEKTHHTNHKEDVSAGSAGALQDVQTETQRAEAVVEFLEKHGFAHVSHNRWRMHGYAQFHRATPLHHAVMLRNADMVSLLLVARADICQKNFSGQTPLQLADQLNLDANVWSDRVHCSKIASSLRKHESMQIEAQR